MARRPKARPDRAPRPLLSASLIVKDEEAVIERCLASLAGAVDEIVVLDTGSTDRTVEIARDCGARVVHGEWHDDFARARNEALRHCRGRWAVVVDADEALRVSDVGALRRMLEHADVDAVQVAVDSFSDDAGTVGVTHQSVRILNRARTRYEGRLHEQVRHVEAGRRLAVARTDLLSLAHWGYIQRVVDERGKTDRNIRICARAIAEGAGVRGEVDMGRTLAAAGRHDEALRYFAGAIHDQDRQLRRTAITQAIQSLLKSGRPTAALDWLPALQKACTRQGTVAVWSGRVRLAMGEIGTAVMILSPHLEGQVIADDDGMDIPVSRIRAELGEALIDADQLSTGAEHLLAAARAGAVKVWPSLVGALAQLGWLDRGVALIDPEGEPDQARLVLAELAAHPPEGVGAFLSVLHDAHPTSPMATVTAPLVADHLDLEEAVTWAARTRSLGLEAHCPLLTRALGETLPLESRLTSAALALELFGDDRAVPAVEDLAAELPADRFFEVLHLLDQLAPTALQAFVATAANSTARCMAMAQALDAHGERAVAVNVLRFGLEEVAAAGVVRDEAQALLTAWSATS